jgi:hypothetical protein
MMAKIMLQQTSQGQINIKEALAGDNAEELLASR